MSQCKGSGRRGRQILSREFYTLCPFCEGTFFRQSRRGFWLPEHDKDDPDPELPWK